MIEQDRPFNRNETMVMSAIVGVAAGVKAVTDLELGDVLGFVFWAAVAWVACVLFIERGLEER